MGLGIPVVPSRRGRNCPYTPEEIRLLGTMPDEELARRLGRSFEGVRCRRVSAGIGKFAEQGFGVGFAERNPPGGIGLHFGESSPLFCPLSSRVVCRDSPWHSGINKNNSSSNRSGIWRFTRRAAECIGFSFG